MTTRTLHESGRRKLAVLAGGIALLVVGVFGGTDALAQISTTKHNLGSTGALPNQTSTFSGTGEICVFCHTPHAADTAAAVPLWNRTLPSPATYTTYDALGTSTLDGKIATVGSVSLACLSCHDGTQAMNSVINAPGSGLAGDAAWAAGAWSGPGQLAGKINPNRASFLGTDLQNDHPIGIQYAGGGITSAANTTGPGADPDFVNPTFSNTLGSTPVWWVDTGGPGTRQKTDMILYTRTSANAAIGGAAIAGGTQPYVECASCHDPHTSNSTFLRIANTGSAVCLACHVK